GHLGDDDVPLPSEAGDLARALQDDTAEFAATPLVYPINDEAFLSRGVPVPVRFAELKDRFRFYWLQLPIALFPKHQWAFTKLEVAVEFNPGDAGPARPKAYQVLPDKKFQTLGEFGMQAKIKLDSNFEFSAEMPKVAVPAGPVPVTAAAGAGID